MIPPVGDPKWAQVLGGAIQHEFSALPAGLLFSRLRREIKKDGSAENLRKCSEEAYAFLLKYENLCAADIATLFG